MDQDEDEVMMDELGTIATKAMRDVLADDLHFMPDKVNTWCQAIMDQCLKEYARPKKKFKYIVSCFIMQKNGAGFQCASTCFWDTKTDGIMSVTGDFKHLNCLVTIYAVHV
jgi:dynein light chain Tctex-type 1